MIGTVAAIGWLALGLLALIAGAELITRGGVQVATRVGVPPIIIGLTIVALGTSTPELAVGIEAARRGSGSLAIANIAGTNIVNILLILGLSALLRPLALTMQTLRFDLPVMTLVAVALVVLALDGSLTRAEGIVMMVAALIYTVAIVRLTRRESFMTKIEFAREFRASRRLSPIHEVLLNLAALIVGIAVVVIGSDWLVDGGVALARTMGISDAVIGLTIVAIGTSAPELVTTVIGTLRNDRDIAIGNLLGSSIYNILVILGLTCIVSPEALPVERHLALIDIPLMALVAIVCVPVFLSARRVSRLEGGMFVGAYVVYLTYLIVART